MTNKKRYNVSLDKSIAEDIKRNVDDFSKFINDFLIEKHQIYKNTSDKTEFKMRQMIGDKTVELSKIDNLIADLKFKRPIIEAEQKAIIKQLNEYLNKKKADMDRQSFRQERRAVC